MTTNITPSDTTHVILDGVRGFDGLIAHARAELAAMTAAALADARAAVAEAETADTSTSAPEDDFSLHEIHGVGRYAIPRYFGWNPLIDIIRNPAANIDFSLKDYPAFDAVVAEHTKSPHLIDPLDVNFFGEDYESYRKLRENIAAVRNFLMQTYYVDTPTGMTPSKAEKSLREIAAFVGEGLHNNWLFLGMIPNHNPTKPFISISDACEGDGRGAQYIYEKILEMQRHSSWLRPFEAVLALFGFKTALCLSVFTFYVFLFSFSYLSIYKSFYL